MGSEARDKISSALGAANLILKNSGVDSSQSNLSQDIRDTYQIFSPITDPGAWYCGRSVNSCVTAIYLSAASGNTSSGTSTASFGAILLLSSCSTLSPGPCTDDSEEREQE